MSDTLFFGTDWDTPVDTSAFNFDPRYGMDLEALLRVEPPEVPPGFENFWRNECRLMQAREPSWKVLASEDLEDGWRRVS